MLQGQILGKVQKNAGANNMKYILYLIIILIGIILSSYGLYLSLATENKCEVMREYIK